VAASAEIHQDLMEACRVAQVTEPQ